MKKNTDIIETISKTLLLLIFILTINITLSAQTQTHPFLLVDSTLFQEMRNQQNTEPWVSMKNKAFDNYNKTRINISSQTIQACAYQIRDVVDANALLYIIDPANKEIYKTKILTYLYDWNEMKKHTKWKPSPVEWYSEVSVGGAFFASVLGYDVIYNDMSQVERDAIDNLLGPIADEFYDGIFGTHQLNQWGASGIWYVFKNHSRKASAITKYRERLFYYINEDGIFQNSINYAQARLSTAPTLAKGIFMDVLEFTNEDNSYYSNPRMQKFYHWLYAHTITPNGNHLTFGDSRGTKSYTIPGIYKAHKFSKEAAEVAAWRVQLHGYTPSGGLVNYVLHNQAFPESKEPKSKIYPDGGAFYIENNTTKNSLAGALWNPKDDANHSHKDINAIHLSAYGEHIIRNSGYKGWGSGYEQFTWNDIANRAWSNNVVLINSVDHLVKEGNGITEGFTADKFDYACGDDGNAILSSKHLRSLIMVHAQDNLDGYFLLFDEVDAAISTNNVNVLTHPNSVKANIVSDKTEYNWAINNYNKSNNNTNVNVFLATEPISTAIKAGPLAAAGESMIGQYIDAEYATNLSGKKKIVTVIYPHDNTHTKVNMTRVTGDNYSGAEIAVAEGIRDYAIESDGINDVNVNGVTFNGIATIFRTGSSNSNFFFVRKGKAFNDGNLVQTGFNTSQEISIYLKDYSGNIISGGSDVKFYYPDVKGVKLNGQAQSVITSGENWVEIYVPEGTHEIVLTNSITSVDDKQTPNNYFLKQNYPNPFNPTTVINYQIPEQSDVSIKVFDVLGNEVVELVNERQAVGNYNIKFSGATLPSGIYFYRLSAGKYLQTKKMILIK